VLPDTLEAPDGEASVDVEEMLPPSIPPLHAPGVDTTMAEARLRVPRRPAVGGASIAHHAFPVGTVALGVRHRQTGAHCILSCSHVLSQLGAAQLGDEVLQPAPDDGGMLPLSVIGRVLSWTPVVFGGVERNMTDAAIAACAPGQVRSWVEGIGAITGVAPPIELLGKRVSKVGRATGLTSGIVTVVGATVGRIRSARFRPDAGVVRQPDRGGDRQAYGDPARCWSTTRAGRRVARRQGGPYLVQPVRRGVRGTRYHAVDEDAWAKRRGR
jgi:hypothetical protein